MTRAWFDPLSPVETGDGPVAAMEEPLARALGVADGTVVALGAEGRRALARARVGGGPGGGVGLDRQTRSVLRPFPYEPVDLSPVSPAAAERVTVSATCTGGALDALLSRGLQGSWPVHTGTVLAEASADHGGSPATAVVVEVYPPEAVLAPSTEVVLDPRSGEVHGNGHTHGGRPVAAGEGAGAEPGFDAVGGLGPQIAAVRELVELPLLRPEVYAGMGIAPPRGVLFVGPPGTGKTLTARAVATEVEAAFYRVSGPEIVGSYSGQTEENLRRLFAEAQRSAPSVILVDEIDAIAPSRRMASTMSDTRSVGQLLALMDGLRSAGGVVVVGTTNQVESIDPALRRPGRFDRELHFPTPGAAERREILRVHVRAMPLSREAVAVLPEVASAAHGFVGADLMELAREAGLRALRRRASLSGGPARLGTGPVVVEGEDLRAALAAVRPAALRQSLVTESTARMSDIGGYEEVKARLCDLARLALDGSAGRTIGVLLEGPPGTGKTLLAQAVAVELGVNLVVVRGPEVYSQWLGESEEAVRRVFAVARRSAPVVVVMDQLDALAPRRESSGGDPTRASQRVVGQLLAEMDGGEPLGRVFVVGVTTRGEDVDPAVLRPGRIGLRLEVALPGAEDRRPILEMVVSRVGGSTSSWGPGDLERVVEASEGLSGADISFAGDLAVLARQRRRSQGPLGVEDFEEGLAMLLGSRSPAPRAGAAGHSNSHML